jgi:hypothetical protein
LSRSWELRVEANTGGKEGEAEYCTWRGVHIGQRVNKGEVGQGYRPLGLYKQSEPKPNIIPNKALGLTIV